MNFLANPCSLYIISSTICLANSFVSSSLSAPTHNTVIHDVNAIEDVLNVLEEILDFGKWGYEFSHILTNQSPISALVYPMMH